MKRLKREKSKKRNAKASDILSTGFVSEAESDNIVLLSEVLEGRDAGLHAGDGSFDTLPLAHTRSV